MKWQSRCDYLHFPDEYECHDDAEDRDGFAEDDGDEVLRADARRLHAAAEDRRARRENAPAGRSKREWCKGEKNASECENGSCLKGEEI